MKNNNLRLLLTILCLLFLFSIACKQSGEIITPAEATQRYVGTQAVLNDDAVVEVTGAEFPLGSSAGLTGGGFLVGLYKLPGDLNTISYASKGDIVTVIGSADVDGVIWYKVETSAGTGWLAEESLIHPE